MKYVVCIPDGCADEPTALLDGATPLEVANTPTLDILAARGEVGLAAVIPDGLPPGSDVGNMAILGYDPAIYHTGRAPIEAAALGLRLRDDEVAFRCNLVTVADDGTMLDHTGGIPDDAAAAEMVAALQNELGGEVTFHPGVQYRHTVIAPAEWADAVCTPPHDRTGQLAIAPTGPAGPWLRDLEERSVAILDGFESPINRIALWGQGLQPEMPGFTERYGVTGGVVTAVDLVRGLAVLTGMDVARVAGATAWYDTNYEGKRDAALAGLADGLDLFVIHVEASDEAGHAGDAEEKVRALENWDARILRDLVKGLDDLGPWRMLLLPDHATPLDRRTHTTDAVPYLLVDSVGDGPGGVYSEAGVAGAEPIVGHELMARLIG